MCIRDSNVAMREQALKKGYTLSEHGLYTQIGKIKGDRVENEFPDEQSIFKFLGIKYKEPKDRKGVRSIEPVGSEPEHVPEPAPTSAPKKKAPKLNTGSIPTGAPTKKRKASNLNVALLPAALENPKSSPVSHVKNKTLKKKSQQPACDLSRDFQTKGSSVLKTQTDDVLASMLTAADEAYHCDQKPLMTDTEYDILKEHLAERDSTNPAVTAVGTNVKKNKVDLPYEMPSMDKIKPCLLYTSDAADE